MDLPQSSQGGQKPFHFGREDFPLDFHLDVQQNFGDPEEAHDHGNEADAVQQFGNIEGEAGQAGNVVQTHRADDQTESGHHQGPDHGGGGQEGQNHQAQDHQGKIFGRPEFQGEIHQGRSDQDQADDADRSRR